MGEKLNGKEFVEKSGAYLPAGDRVSKPGIGPGVEVVYRFFRTFVPVASVVIRTELLIVALSLSLAVDLRAEESSAPSPSDPTAAATHVEIMPEYNKGDGLESELIRVVVDKDWAEGKYSVTLELPYGNYEFEDGGKETGIGDLRTRLFWKFYDAPEKRIVNMVAGLDVFLPTGDEDKGMGLGTSLLVPSVIMTMPMTDASTLFVIPKYKVSLDKTKGRSSPFSPGRNPIPRRESEEWISAFELELAYAYDVAKYNAWLFLAPIMEWDMLPESNEDNYELTLKGQVGKMFGKWGLGLEGTTYVAGEKTQDYQARLLYYYFF